MCKTSCQSSRCKCKRAGNYCYGCKCVGCCNLPGPTPGQVTDSALSTPLESGSEEEERDNESYKELEEDIDATMLEVFGDYDIQSVSEISDNDSLSNVDMDDDMYRYKSRISKQLENNLLFFAKGSSISCVYYIWLLPSAFIGNCCSNTISRHPRGCLVEAAFTVSSTAYLP